MECYAIIKLIEAKYLDCLNVIDYIRICKSQLILPNISQIVIRLKLLRASTAKCYEIATSYGVKASPLRSISQSGAATARRLVTSPMRSLSSSNCLRWFTNYYIKFIIKPCYRNIFVYVQSINLYVRIDGKWSMNKSNITNKHANSIKSSHQCCIPERTMTPSFLQIISQ